MKNKILIKILIMIIATAFAGLASGCGTRCKEAREYILEPTKTVTTYLEANPTGQNLAESGCQMVVKLFENIPHGAKTIREIANTRFTDSWSECIRWETSWRTICHGVPAHPRPIPYYSHPRNPPVVCHREPYTYCASWEHHTVREPGYEQAMELSRELDLMYEKTHHMCGEAGAGNFESAQAESKDILKYIKEEVKPDGDYVYALACK